MYAQRGKGARPHVHRVLKREVGVKQLLRVTCVSQVTHMKHVRMRTGKGKAQVRRKHTWVYVWGDRVGQARGLLGACKRDIDCVSGCRLRRSPKMRIGEHAENGGGHTNSVCIHPAASNLHITHPPAPSPCSRAQAQPPPSQPPDAAARRPGWGGCGPPARPGVMVSWSERVSVRSVMRKCGSVEV